jgi:hypothetical protein
MNFNALIAVLVIKQIITREEGEALVDHLHDKPQSTILHDALQSVGEIIGAPVASSITAQLGPVGPEQRNEEIAAQSAQAAPQLAPPPLPVEDVSVPAPEPHTGSNDTHIDAKPKTDTPKEEDKPAQSKKAAKK